MKLRSVWSEAMQPISNSRRTSVVLSLLALAITSADLGGQQVVDSSYAPSHVSPPAYAAGTGPVVVIDEAHQNFHTMSARYLPFARLLRADGYVVHRGTARYDSAALAGVRLLVVARARMGKKKRAYVPASMFFIRSRKRFLKECMLMSALSSARRSGSTWRTWNALAAGT